jgi:tRNA(Ile)-lysidine synthase
MKPNERNHAVRPLIDVRRVEVAACCRALRLRPRLDPSNTDRRFLRNALRLDVLPVAERITGRDVKGPIARSAALLQDDAAELFDQGARAFAKVAVTRDGDCLMRARSLSALPDAIAGRVVRMAMWQFGVDLEREGVHAVLDLARGRPGRKRDLPRGLIATREKEYVRLSRTSPGSGGGRGKGGV